MSQKVETKRVVSQPTMCLQCHLVVAMFYDEDGEPRPGAWECPNCGHKYPFAHWKIKKQTRSRTKAA